MKRNDELKNSKLTIAGFDVLFSSGKSDQLRTLNMMCIGCAASLNCSVYVHQSEFFSYV